MSLAVNRTEIRRLEDDVAEFARQRDHALALDSNADTSALDALLAQAQADLAAGMEFQRIRAVGR